MIVAINTIDVLSPVNREINELDCSGSDANVYIPTTIVPAMRGRDGQHKGTLSKEERDVINT